MARGARVQSIDAIRMFRAALLKFAETADSALADADGEVTRTMVWLQTEQPTYWRGQVRRRTEALARAKEALRMKTQFKDSSGRPPPADQERKAVALATRALDEAQQKLQTIRKWTLQLQKETSSFRGSVQRLATSLQTDVPRAAAELDQIAGRLDAYASLSAPQVSAMLDEDEGESMARPEPPARERDMEESESEQEQS